VMASNRLKEVKLTKATEQACRERARRIYRLIERALLKYDVMAPGMVVHDTAPVTAYTDGEAWVTARLLIRVPKPARAKPAKPAKVQAA
jgi:hypothetical protein